MAFQKKKKKIAIIPSAIELEKWTSATIGFKIVSFKNVNQWFKSWVSPYLTQTWI